MSKAYQLSLHIFRRDLRLIDNTAFNAALEASHTVFPCFIFDDKQIVEHAYFSKKAFSFMLESLGELAETLTKKGGRLYFFIGDPQKIITDLLRTHPINAVFINRDYTPFSRERDDNIQLICKAKGIDFYSYADTLLHEPEEVLKPNGKPYTIFTPFYRRASVLEVAVPHEARHSTKYYTGLCASSVEHAIEKLSVHADASGSLKGGRSNALKCLKKISQLQYYADVRNYPALSATTHLSPHHKFGTISIREVYHAVCEQWGHLHTLINELCWRDFFTHITFHFPHVLQGAFHEQYNTIQWQHNEDFLTAWQSGYTGFPIVDAGMRELNTTGYMHNRVRMIVASFLTKDLLIDWRFGEKYFATTLIDYDPAVNNGNWQWAASTGCDAQPYFRIFNPWLQQKKFDAECEYIKKWVPELSALTPQEIHYVASERRLSLKNYVAPIVDHAIQSAMAKSLYRAISNK